MHVTPPMNKIVKPNYTPKCSRREHYLVVFSLIIQLMQRKNIVGLRVRKARKELKITQMKLAAQMQLLDVTIDRSGVAKIEGGLRPVSDIEIAAMARILKVTISWLFEDSDKKFNMG